MLFFLENFVTLEGAVFLQCFIPSTALHCVLLNNFMVKIILSIHLPRVFSAFNYCLHNTISPLVGKLFATDSIFTLLFVFTFIIIISFEVRS